MILSICDRSYMVQVFLIIKIFFKMLCILAPIIIILASIYNLFTAIRSGKDEDLKANLTMLVRRVIAGLLIFFLPNIISYVFMDIVKADDVSFISCFDSASVEKVRSLREKEAAEAKAEAEREKREAEALEKENYQKDQAERDKQKKVFEEEKKKREEEERRKKGLGGGVSGSSETISANSPGVSLKEFKGANGSNMKYWEITPTSPKSNLPLIVFLHGMGETNDANGVASLPIMTYANSTKDSRSNQFILIAPIAPSNGWAEKVKMVKGIIDETITKYNIDTNHVIITGMSMGGYGTFNMVDNYGSFFSAAVPMSGCSDTYNPNAMTGVPWRAIVGGNEGSINRCMNTMMGKIKNAGGNAYVDVVPGADHGTVQQYYRTEELYDWMLRQ